MALYARHARPPKALVDFVLVYYLFCLFIFFNDYYGDLCYAV